MDTFVDRWALYMNGVLVWRRGRMRYIIICKQTDAVSNGGPIQLPFSRRSRQVQGSNTRTLRTRPVSASPPCSASRWTKRTYMFCTEHVTSTQAGAPTGEG